MELHPVHGGFAVAQTHNDAVVGGGGGFQDLVHGFGYDCQGVIAGRGEGVGHIFEYGTFSCTRREVLPHEFGAWVTVPPNASAMACGPAAYTQ